MTPPVVEREAEPGAYDPLDLQLDRVAPRQSDESLPTGHRPAARAWSPDVQAVVLLLVGAALGRNGLAILGEGTLSLLDPVVPVALAALGVLVAFEVGAASWSRSRVLVAASIQALLAAAVVIAGALALAPLLIDTPIASSWVFAIALGVCASTSSALTASATTGSTIARVADMDAVLPIIVGGLMMAALREQAAVPALVITAQVVGIALTVAVAGWLLLARTGSETEHRIFSAATLLLLGGVADYLSLSALMAGLVAGTFWHLMGGAARESIRRDLTHLHHPLVALILVVAGARTEITPGIAGVAVIYVVLRAVGKLAGGIAATAIDRAPSPDIAPRLLAPGIFGVAFALNSARALGPEMAIVVSVAVLGTIGSQLLAGARPSGDAT
jgi:hypothetical protein